MSMRWPALAAAAAVMAAACAPGAAAAPGAATPAARAATPPPSPTPTPVPALTLGGLFHPQGPVTADPAHVWTLNATGDTIPARLVDVAAASRGDYVFPFPPTADYVKNADVTYVNLE